MIDLQNNKVLNRSGANHIANEYGMFFDKIVNRIQQMIEFN